VSEPAYLRHPHLHGELVTFVAEDDVWVAPVAGGRAWRVSDDHAPAAAPRFSPDGSQIAWVSAREGAPEVFTAPTAGGPTRRLTWWGATPTFLLGWTADGAVLASSGVGQAAARRCHAHRIPLTGGPSQILPWGLVGGVGLEPGGTGVLVSTPSQSEPAWRKRYRGGTAPVLWLDASGDGRFTRLLAGLRSGLVCPMWTTGGRIAFVSDHEGTGQLYSLPTPTDAAVPTAADPTRHTDSPFYVRHAGTDGTRVVWASAGSLWLLDDLDPAAGATPRQLDLSLGGARAGRAARRLPAEGAVTAVAPDRTGRGSALEVRGTVQWLPHRDGPARLLTPSDEPVRGRSPVVLGDTGRVAWVTDAGDEDGIAVSLPEVDGGAGSTTILASGELGTVLELVASPDGGVLAAAAHDGRLLTVEVATGLVREVARSGDGEVRGLAFSPDGRWLAWSHPGPEPLSHIRLVGLDGGEPVDPVVDVTPLKFSDASPAFSADGRHLAFLSLRSFDPVYDTVAFDMAFVAGWRPYLVPLDARTPSPFDPSGSGRPADESADRPGAPGAGVDPKAAAVVPSTTVDADGLADRLGPFPVDAGVLTELRAVTGGFTWLRDVPAGVLGDDRARLADEPKRPALQRFDLATRTQRTLLDAVDGYAVTGDGSRLVVRDHDDLVVVRADRPVPAEPEPGSSDRVSIDLARVHVDLDPAVEWRQEFGEAWRRMRDNFWRADMDGVDWAGVRARYEPLLAAIATADDFVDVLWEVQGELATSHAYVRPKERKSPERRAAFLGADLTRDDAGTWRVDRVLPGESSDPRARSPLAAPGVGVRSGDALMAVGGRPVSAADGLGPLLVGTADTPVALTIAPADGSAARSVVVVPVAEEIPLRYHDWVAGRRAATHELSGGRLGYVHVPDMVGSGWAQLYRDLRLETAYEGLIVDVRENRGGHTSQLVIEKLARRVVGWDFPRNMDTPSRYPADAPRGPVVLIANQWSGSDGDIVNVVAQALRIGPVVGERTWGGVIGIDSRYTLVDGTTINQPRYASWFAGPGWGVENHGVDPDVEVVLTPQDRSAGLDPQLETAVRLALDSLAATPAASPPAFPPPHA
jgi:tricorn protease